MSSPSTETEPNRVQLAISTETGNFEKTVRFAGHPDLRRILTWEDFPAHPLRKDYPLRGRGERETYIVVDRDAT